MTLSIWHSAVKGIDRPVAERLSLAEHAASSCPELVQDGTWARIEQCVATAHEDIEARLDDAPLPAVALFVDELSSIVNNMRLDAP